jgi:hypothetical protein
VRLASGVGIVPQLVCRWLQRRSGVLVLQDFDMVNHLLFLHKLGSEYDFHSSFLKDRSMVVEVDGVRSSPRSLFSGVPQSCIPCPLFLSMLINGLYSFIRFAKFHFYADDLQII